MRVFLESYSCEGNSCKSSSNIYNLFHIKGRNSTNMIFRQLFNSSRKVSPSFKSRLDLYFSMLKFCTSKLLMLYFVTLPNTVVLDILFLFTTLLSMMNANLSQQRLGICIWLNATTWLIKTITTTPNKICVFFKPDPLFLSRFTWISHNAQ